MDDNRGFFEDHFPWQHWNPPRIDVDTMDKKSGLFDNAPAWFVTGFFVVILILVLSALCAICKASLKCCCTIEERQKPKRRNQRRGQGQNGNRRNDLEETRFNRNAVPGVTPVAGVGTAMPPSANIPVVTLRLPEIATPSAPPLTPPPGRIMSPGHHIVSVQHDPDYDPPPPYPGYL